jgi:ectoine hydroxylase-related dioxygenase (phytanoyl-CoA dioxygenase family)
MSFQPTYKDQFEDLGYVVVRGLFSAEEVAAYRDHYMTLRENGTYPGDSSGVEHGSADPLKRYPRLIHMHRWDEISLKWLLDARLRECLTGLLGREPFAVQTMIYFKPPGARGQALHQDQYYLRVNPGTCIAAWMALDTCDDDNGCLRVVPHSQNWDVLCAVPADISQSFTDVTVEVPEGQPIESVHMQPGDVLFFNGSLVHGSNPNITTDRFRRAMIAHYIEGSAEQVGEWYHPALRMDGSVIELGSTADATRCGIWVDKDGQPEIELVTVSNRHVVAHE